MIISTAVLNKIKLPDADCFEGKSVLVDYTMPKPITAFKDFTNEETIGLITLEFRKIPIQLNSKYTILFFTGKDIVGVNRPRIYMWEFIGTVIHNSEELILEEL